MELSTSTNIYFRRPSGRMAPIEESIEKCAAAGFRHMDLNFLDCTTFKLPFVGDNWQEWLESVERTAADNGVIFTQAHAPFYNFCDPLFANRDYIDRLIFRSIDCSAELHVPWLVIHAGTDYGSARMAEASKRKNREYFLPVVEYAAKRGVGIAFENLWDYNIAPRRRYTVDISELVDLIDSFESDTVGACYDTDHVILSELGHYESLACIGSRLKATHISDCINIDSDHYIPFFGKGNWNDIIGALSRIRYQGDLTYEMHRLNQNVPDELVDATLKYSITVGQYLLDLFERFSKELENGN